MTAKSSQSSMKTGINSSLNSESIQLPPPRFITVVVEKIVNIDTKKISALSVRIEFMGQLLVESSKTAVLDDGTAEVDLSSAMQVAEMSMEFVDNLLANPIVFIILNQSNSGTKSEILKAASKPGTAKSVAPERPKVEVLGNCNLDMRPLVTGSKKISETLIVELEKKASAQDVVSWMNLPRLVATISTSGESLIPEKANRNNNVIGVTVESIYNAPDSIPEGTAFGALFPVARFSDKTENIRFDNGLKTCHRDCECAKRWSTLSAMEGRGGLTKHRISHDPMDILNPFDEEVDMEKMLNEHVSRIHWNQVRNCLMTQTASNFFFGKITKYRVWPIEVLVSSNGKSGNGKTAKTASKTAKGPGTASIVSADHYTAFLDVSSLLYPGVTRVRVASQLYTYSVADLTSKWGFEISVPVQPSLVMKGKPATAKPAEPEPEKESPGVPLLNEQGQPVFIVVEVEVWKPFTAKRSPEYLEEKLSAYFPVRGKVSTKAICLALAEEAFAKNIQAISKTIRAEYQKFMADEEKSDVSEDNFFDYLCQAGTFQKIKATLNGRITDLVCEKFGHPSLCKNIIPEIYMYLVQEMHKIVNSCITEWGQFSRAVEVGVDNQQLFAEEAEEEDEVELARKYLLARIAKCRMNPDYWLDYSVFCLGIEENDKAIECVREALSWNISHQIGLVLYGLVLTKTEDYNTAEMAFELLLQKHPDFVEGWIILHLFYMKIDNHEGSEVALQTAMKIEHRKKTNTDEYLNNGEENPCSQNIGPTTLEEAYEMMAEGTYGMASYVKGQSSTDSLSWTRKLCPENSVNIRTAVFLLKMRNYELAEMALGQELILQKRGRTVPYLYYLSVSHYLRGKYREALSHLDVAVREFGKDCSLWSLMGHCYHKMHDYANSVSCYEYVMESYNRPDDIHLVFLRMSDYYIKTKKFKCAKRVSICACKYSPSPKTWLRVGLSCYKLLEFEEAEEAFKEANYLDNLCPVIWGYLALVNLQLGRYDVFQQCYLEAVKKQLMDENLLKQIKTLSQLHGLQNS